MDDDKKAQHIKRLQDHADLELELALIEMCENTENTEIECKRIKEAMVAIETEILGNVRWNLTEERI